MALLLLVAAMTVWNGNAFVIVTSRTNKPHKFAWDSVRSSLLSSLSVTPLWYSSKTNVDDGDGDDEITVTWLEDPEDGELGTITRPTATLPSTTATVSSSSRWDSLNPKIKERLIKAGQERAIANKKKREPDHDKKRRTCVRACVRVGDAGDIPVYMNHVSTCAYFFHLTGQLLFMKEKQRERKRASRVKRPVSFDDRTPLAALIPGMELTGICISLTNFGAYIDIGTEVDGLLHISQMSCENFVEHPRQVVAPGDEIAVTVRSINPERKKLHLTMLPPDIVQQQLENEASEAIVKDRIPLTDIQVDDELWGELKRVTDFGAYVEVGAAVDGFLHFMDHPDFGNGLRESRPHPTDFMRRGDRVRVWVSDVDLEQNRIKLTAHRPNHLPGPRRELS